MRLVDDDTGASPRVSRGVEEAAGDQRNPQRPRSSPASTTLNVRARQLRLRTASGGRTPGTRSPSSGRPREDRRSALAASTPGQASGSPASVRAEETGSDPPRFRIPSRAGRRRGRARRRARNPDRHAAAPARGFGEGAPSPRRRRTRGPPRTTKSARRWLCRDRPLVAPSAGLPQSRLRVGARDAWSAGARPKRVPVSDDAAKVKRRTSGSMRVSREPRDLGRSDGDERAASPRRRAAMPSTPPRTRQQQALGQELAHDPGRGPRRARGGWRTPAAAPRRARAAGARRWRRR